MVNKILFFFILILFLIINFNFSNGIIPPINELNALQLLISKFNLTIFNNIPNTEICTVLTCDQTTGSILSMLIIGNDKKYTPIGAEVVSSDFLPFPNLFGLNFRNMSISVEFLYNKINSVESVSYTNIIGINEINQTLPSYREFFLVCDCPDGSNFKMSYINQNTSNFQIENSYLNLINDFPTLNKLVSLRFGLNNLPNMSNYFINSMGLDFGPNFDVTSFVLNYKTIKSSYREIKSSAPDMYFPIETLADQYVSNVGSYNMRFQLKFNGPQDNKPLNISNNKIGYLTISKPGKFLNIENNSLLEFPLILNYDCKLIFEYGSISQTKPISQFGNPYIISMKHSNISGDLDKYELPNSYQPRIYDFSGNAITGTIDKSWCNAILLIRDNKMTGPIPSCFSCYFNSPLVDSSLSTYPTLYGSFEGNNFTNLDLNLPCTTFKPQIERQSNQILIIYGNDIGFNGYLYKINGTITCKTYDSIEFGKKFRFIVNNSISFADVNYLSINFAYPFDKDYYFPLIVRSPIINYVYFSNDNNLQVNGAYFSSYLGHVPQTLTISDYTFQIFDSSDFFTIQANSTKSIPVSLISTNKFLLLTLTTNSNIKRVYVALSSTNDKVCKNDCTDNDHGICNLYLGTCVCLNDFVGDDCSLLNFFITSVQPSTTNGGEAIFFGSFLEPTNNISLTIGGIDCPITFNSSDTIKCIAQPGNGIKTVILKLNNKIFTGVDIYKYIELSIPCPNKCSNNGYCNSTTGICKCNKGFTLYDCSALINIDDGLGNINNNTNNGGGGTNTTIDPGTGSTNFTNSQTNFQIYLKSLIEVDINNNEVKSYSLLKNWIFNKTENEIEPNKYILKQQLVNNTSPNSNGCIITSTIEEIKDKNGKEFTFAGTSFIVSSGSIKFTISIANYIYQSNLNTLKLELISSVDKIDKINNCNSKDTEIDTTNVNDLSTFNYIKISKNNKIFSGRFINKVLSDGRSTFFTTNARNDSNSIIVSLNLPHCINECLIDPDFSVLISNDFKSECDGDDSSRKWFLPVVVVVPVVGVAFIIIIMFIIYKRSTTLKIMLHATKLKKFNHK
ncbi:hypothetical protein ACTFIZ_001867 [Dictyostelium cf. discoideum]